MVIDCLEPKDVQNDGNIYLFIKILFLINFDFMGVGIFSTSLSKVWFLQNLLQTLFCRLENISS